MELTAAPFVFRPLGTRFALALLAFTLTGCLAKESTLRAHNTDNAAGQLNIVQALSAKNAQEVEAARKYADDALALAQKLETEAATSGANLTAALARIIPGGPLVQELLGSLSTASAENASARADLNSTLVNRISASEETSRVDRETARLEVSGNVEGVRREAKADLTAFSSSAEERLNRLDTSIQTKLEAGATQENLEALRTAAATSEQAFRDEFTSRLGLTEEEAKQAGELSTTEILEMLALLLATGGASTFASRKLSPSATKIDEANRELAEIKLRLAEERDPNLVRRQPPVSPVSPVPPVSG